jgi:flagellar basal body-associated protein FliL
MEKILLYFFCLVLIMSCTKNVPVYSVLSETNESGYTSYNWKVRKDEAKEGIDHYKLLIENNGRTTLYIAHFSDLSKTDKAESVEEQIGVQVSNIEHSGGKIKSITIDGIKYHEDSDELHKRFEEISNEYHVGTTEEHQGETPLNIYFDQIKQIRTRTADTSLHSISVKVEIGYMDGDEQVATELTAINPLMTDIFRTYFASKTAEELISDEQKIQDELKEKINSLLKNGQIESIIFTEYQIFDF